MRWPWKRGDDDAWREADRAAEQLDRVRDRWPAVRDAVGSMNEHYEGNGFAELIQRAMGVRGQ